MMSFSCIYVLLLTIFLLQCSHIDSELFNVQQLLAQGWGNWGVDARKRGLTAGKFFAITTDGQGLRNLQIIHILFQ